MSVGKHWNRCRPAVERSAVTLFLLTLMTLVWAGDAMAGASCAVAKRLGDSLAIEWVAAPDESVESAIHKTKQKLIEQGYRKKGQDVHAQASTGLRHAHMVIVKTTYTTMTGRTRTSYGCGYSPRSSAEAERAALYDLRNYSWGWKPELGYEVLQSFRY
ncbi:MAG: hypothetical protein AB2565_13175 [Candidatus Thiodiazotropha endolucinida]|uniref:Uncharacterized protein n=1 Tax=Candidatus Thiodiazotropha endolucinida TaxID=1655433 RepID=A0A7Z1AG43_9GAMM|nr:hypothetical protein [Candidatus Thiodiazotropha endolucinida]ODJ88542.1 hypothetical protein CODIS_10880 [Candidatus Thiodiazotropha endolucinida]